MKKLGILNIREGKITIMSLDIMNIYSSTKLSPKKGFQYYAQNLTPSDKEIIGKCMSMSAFGMRMTLVHFQDCYYNYKGVVKEGTDNPNEVNNGLAIGAFKVKFCAGGGTTFVYEMCKAIMLKLDYAGTYQDNGLTIFAARRMLSQSIKWLQKIQCKVDK
eukprot:11526018-Ditylum_brightwellii.AAC.1